MARTVGEHMHESNWSFSVQEVFHLRSNDDDAIVVLAGNILSGHEDDPIGRAVRVIVGGDEVGQGVIISRFKFDQPASGGSAYQYDGSFINRDDLDKKIVLVLRREEQSVECEILNSQESPTSRHSEFDGLERSTN